MHFAFEFVSMGSTIRPIPPAIIVFDIGVPVSVRALDSRLLYKWSYLIRSGGYRKNGRPYM